MEWLCRTLIDRHQASFEFTAWSTNELGANYSISEWLPPQPNGDCQHILDTRHNWVVAPAGGIIIKACWGLQCGARRIIYHTTWCRSGVQFFFPVRCHWLEAVKIHRGDPSRRNCYKAVCLNQYRDFGRRQPSIGYNKHRKWLGNEERGGGKEIPQNGQGPRLYGDVAGQPQSMCYTDEFSSSKQAADCYRIHFRHWGDYQSILVTLSM